MPSLILGAPVFFALKQPKLELSDHAELPSWLQGTKKDVWERCNRWILQMALTEGAKQTTLLALWDGKKDESDGFDRTAYVVDLARKAGNVDVRIIDTKDLLKSGSATVTISQPPEPADTEDLLKSGAAMDTASLPPWPAPGGERR